jgi:hypothetical protein
VNSSLFISYPVRDAKRKSVKMRNTYLSYFVYIDLLAWQGGEKQFMSGEPAYKQTAHWQVDTACSFEAEFRIFFPVRHPHLDRQRTDSQMFYLALGRVQNIFPAAI